MSDIHLHVTSRGADRATLVGANGTGKSTLASYLIAAFKDDYPDARVLVHDTKPRWRGEYLADGTRASRRYKRMAKGDTIPGSMVLERPDDWALVWDRNVNPSQIVVCQRLRSSMRTNIVFQTMAAERFFSTQDANRPSLIYFDEGMDFFHASATARGGSDIVQRCYRAGREMGLASMLGAQRPIGINAQTLTEVNYCALFALNYTKDVRRLWEMGWPRNALPPTRHDVDCQAQCIHHDPDGTFRLWRGGSSAPKFRLNYERKAA